MNSQTYERLIKQATTLLTQTTAPSQSLRLAVVPGGTEREHATAWPVAMSAQRIAGDQKSGENKSTPFPHFYGFFKSASAHHHSLKG